MRFIFVLVILISAAQLSNADLRAGVSVVDITPPAGTPLGGYGARIGKPMEGVHDRIFAKALALDVGRLRIVLVTTDLIGSDLAMQRAIATASQLKPEQVMLCASHSHSGPGALANNIFAAGAMGKYDPAFYDWMQQRLIECAKQAIRKLAPARLAIGFSELTGCSANRRAGGTITDPQLTVIRVDRANGKPLAALVNFSAHGTVLGAKNMLVSGDWMGAMQRSLEKTIGNGAIALYANGAEGDQRPTAPAGTDDFARCEALGHTVAEAAKKVYDGLKTSNRIRLAATGEDLLLPKTVKSSLLGKDKTYLQIIAINDIALIALPGEVIAELGLQIKQGVKASGFTGTVAMGLANDHLGYILTEEEYAKGGYEVTVSFYGEKFGPQLSQAIVELATKLRRKRHD